MDLNADDDAPLQSPGMPLDESDMPLANAFLEEAPLEGTILTDRPLADLWLGDTPKPRYRSVSPLHGLFERPSMDYVAPEYIRDGRNRLLGQMMPLIRQQENQEMDMREMDEKIRELKAQMEALTVPSDDISEEDAVVRREAGIEERRVKTVGDILAELEPAITQRVEREWEQKREKEKKEEEALKMRSKNAEELEVLRLWMRKRVKELRKETEEETRREWVKRVEREVQTEAEENEKRKVTLTPTTYDNTNTILTLLGLSPKLHGSATPSQVYTQEPQRASRSTATHTSGHRKHRKHSTHIVRRRRRNYSRRSPRFTTRSQIDT